MRCPKCHTETPAEALKCPSCKFNTPRGKVAEAASKAAAKEKKRLQATGSRLVFRSSSNNVKSFRNSRVGRWVYAGGIVLFLAVFGAGLYWYIYIAQKEIDAPNALRAMAQLRNLPAKEPGKTIDDMMDAELQKSRSAGELVGFQGWTVRPHEKTSFLISFSFDEKNGKKSADWIVNPETNTFVPTSELAMTVQQN